MTAQVKPGRLYLLGADNFVCFDIQGQMLGYTPLHYAVEKNTEIVKLLLGEIRQMSYDAKLSIFTAQNEVIAETCSAYRAWS